ncbi:MAG TPA: sodium-translocating pyrophosphatase [Aggregatilinea sp.]|uniref:sodium-translocating pyrophosphatase n=1 Tax=Aggregatilinea sp. TaxID=2806333 RepID=UPI002CAE9FC7|nr:sodium-translocating pyrophosphatase [Aggregatilinea sp.]HML20067.1 sodium-translocating pyrophosphatase [Aggregatilinea sp.]
MFQMDIKAFEQVMMFIVLAIAVVALAYAFWLRNFIMSSDKGNSEMQRIWGYIRDGANAYLRTQLKTVAVLIVVLTVAMFLSVFVVKPTPEARAFFDNDEDKARIVIAIARALAFVMGSTFSAMVGFFGMNMAVQGNVRVAAAAEKGGYQEALKIAYRSGTITGMLTDGLGLLGGTTIFIIFGEASPDVLLGFGFGGTLLALFMRVGGGIYTKAADVGADLVGKVEAGMEEDDPRNAAVIADLVGDNVGDCAGMAADIFESYEVTIVSSLILGLALTAINGELYWIVLPLLVRGIGVVSSIVGTYAVSLWHVDDAEEAMFKSYEVSSFITITATFLLAWLYAGQLSLATLVAVGVALAVVFNPLTSYATSAKSERVKTIAASTRYGPASVILEGLSLGYLSSVWALFVIVASLTASILVYSFDFPDKYEIFVVLGGAILSVVWIIRRQQQGHLIEGLFSALWIMVAALFVVSMHEVPEIHRYNYILFGITLIGVGMLSHTGNNVSMDSFGPISDNANGIGELAGMGPEARQIMADLDAAGNTTKAITKGVAIGSAVIAAVSLFGSFFADIQRVKPDFEEVINLANPTVFVGLLIGGSLPLLFSGLLIKAVNRAAGLIMAEVRRQLRDPKILDRTKTPDYAKAVTISTQSAQRELVPLGVIAVLAPIAVGLLLKEQALGGFLAGVIVSGQLLAVFMSNAGGAWDNAKKYVEDGNYGGKNSENHKASVVGDTVGDPLKDTAGPALNPMIKVMNLVSTIMAPIIVQYDGYSIGVIIAAALAVAAIVYAVRQSDRRIEIADDAASERITTAVSASD